MRHDGRPLMVLGAGPSQLSGILKAVGLGCRVITVDFRPGNVGHPHAHHYENCDTRDAACVLAAAGRHAIQGIVTFCSDAALSTLAHVAQRLGLAGPSPSTVAQMCDKARFRAFQREHRLPCPRFIAGEDPEALLGRLRELTPPIFVKPADSSGSKGVARLAAPDPAAFARACSDALACSPGRRLCVEEAVPGVEVGGDAFLDEGRLVFARITRKVLEGTRVVGHVLPDALERVERERVLEALRTACERIGYRSGALNFDVMVGRDAVTILEMSPRNGGNGLTPLIARASGFDLERAMIRAALGEHPRVDDAGRRDRGCGVLILGSRSAGRLARVPELGPLRARVPEVYAVESLVPIGEPVEAFVHSGQAIARVFFDCEDAQDYARIARHLGDHAQPLVEAGSGSPGEPPG